MIKTKLLIYRTIIFLNSIFISLTQNLNDLSHLQAFAVFLQGFN